MQTLDTYIAWHNVRPLVLRRLGVKEGEMRLAIEGSFKTGQTALVLSDLLVSGPDVLDTVDALENEGLEVHDTFSFIELSIAGRKKIKMRGLRAHHLVSLEDIVQILFDAGKIPGDLFKFMVDYFEEHSLSEK